MTRSRFCVLLNMSLADEKKAQKDYAVLRKACVRAGAGSACKRIPKISSQERHHHRILLTIKKSKCKGN